MGSILANLPCTPKYPQSWEQLRGLYPNYSPERGKKWIFRAQTQTRLKKRNRKKPDYHVEGSYFRTSLDRAFARFEPDKKYPRHKLEIALLREFMRKAHHHLMYDLPDTRNTIEWLTVMQHYGAPTRLLDWTYSFYVAAFFAVTRLDCENEYAEIWAANSEWIGKAEERICVGKKLKRLEKLRKDDPVNMDEYHNEILNRLFRKPEPLVVVLNSFKLNERLINQQGTFLVQGDIDISFDDNLGKMGKPPELKENLHRIVIDVTLPKRKEILRHLHRMNINNASLFPGLQGFAESLETQLAYPEKFGIQGREAPSRRRA